MIKAERSILPVRNIRHGLDVAT